MRSLLTITIMATLDHDGELRLHLHAAANSGVTRDEIQETLLQAVIYCDVPAANHAFHLAQTMFIEVGAEGATKK